MDDIRATPRIIYWTIVVIVIFALITGGGLLIQKYAYPWYLDIQRRAVEKSKSFTDANNNMLQTYMLEYARLETKIAEVGNDPQLAGAYEAQQKAIVTKMCLQISTMQKDTVNPDTLAWLNQKGGCR